MTFKPFQGTLVSQLSGGSWGDFNDCHLSGTSAAVASRQAPLESLPTTGGAFVASRALATRFFRTSHMPDYDDLSRYVRWQLKLNTIPAGVIMNVNNKRPNLEGYVRQLRAWLLKESQKPDADTNYAQLYNVIPSIDSENASRERQWGEFVRSVLMPYLQENEKQLKIAGCVNEEIHFAESAKLDLDAETSEIQQADAEKPAAALCKDDNWSTLALKGVGLQPPPRSVLITVATTHPSRPSLPDVESEAGAIQEIFGNRAELHGNISVARLEALLHGRKILFFAGHGDAMLQGEPKLSFEQNGQLDSVSVDELVATVRPHVIAGHLELVVLNGCNTERLGAALCERAGVPNVVCWKSLLHDQAGRIFSEEFAKALALQDWPRFLDTSAAYEAACKAVLQVYDTGRLDSGHQAKIQKFEFADPSDSGLVDPATGRIHTLPGCPAGRIAAGLPVHMTHATAPISDHYQGGASCATDEKMALTLNSVGSKLQTQGHLVRAMAAYQSALAIQEKRHGPDHADVAATLTGIGSVLQKQNKNEEAMANYKRALLIQEKTLGLNHADVAITITNMGIVLEEQGKLEDAMASYKRALEIKECAHGAECAELASTLTGMGNVLQLQGHLAAAMAKYEHALEVQEKTYGPHDAQIAPTLNNMGLLYQAQGQLQEAESLYRRALDIQESAYGHEHAEVAISLGNIAGVLRERGQPVAALTLIQDAGRIVNAVLGSDHPHASYFREAQEACQDEVDDELDKGSANVVDVATSASAAAGDRPQSVPTGAQANEKQSISLESNESRGIEAITALLRSPMPEVRERAEHELKLMSGVPLSETGKRKLLELYMQFQDQELYDCKYRSLGTASYRSLGVSSPAFSSALKTEEQQARRILERIEAQLWPPQDCGVGTTLDGDATHLTCKLHSGMALQED